MSRIRAAVELVESRLLLAAVPVSIGDINQTTNQIGALSTVQVGNVAYFAGRSSSADGEELFKTDGTKAGTVLVKNINPTTGSGPDNFTDVNGTLYFTADDGTTGVELWKSDGTAAGTVQVADLYPGSGSSRPSSLTNVNGTLYFSAYDSANNYWLYETDGTAAGTVKVNHVNGNYTSPFSSPRSFTALNGSLLVSDSTSLFRVDGNSATQIIPTTSFADPYLLMTFNNAVYFTIGSSYGNNNPNSKGDLWKTDGTAAGTVPVKSIDYLSGGSDFTSISHSRISGDRFYFFAGSATGGSYDLWVSDGTTAGTNVVAYGTSYIGGTTIGTPVGAHSLLFLNKGATTGTEPWVSDGTAAGTKLLKDLMPGTASGGDYYGGSVPIAGGKALFTFCTGLGNPAQVWTTDGTVANTVLQTTIPVAPSIALVVGSLNGVALLTATRNYDQGRLYRSDGTAAGTYDVGATLTGNGDGFSGSYNSYTNFWFVDGNTVYFTAEDGNTGQELWKTVNNAAPVRVSDIAAGGGDSAPDQYTRADDGSIYFMASTVSGGFRNIYRLATGSGSPQLVVSNGIGGSTLLSKPVTVGNRLYFIASGGTLTRSQLWRYDPATNSSAAVTVGGLYLSTPSPIVRAGNTWYFGAQPATSTGSYTPVQRLYALTATGDPQTAVDIDSTANVPLPLGAVGNIVVFQATTAAAGRELWRSDGTAGGTSLLIDFSPGTASTYSASNNANLVVTVNGALYVPVSGNTDALIKTDGTSAGTAPVSGADNGNQVISAGGQTYALAYTGSSTQIARIDGTSFTPLTFSAAGDNAFRPTALIGAGNSVFAVGYGGDKARWELWRGTGDLTDFHKVLVLGTYADSNTRGPLHDYFVLGRYALAATATDLYFPAFDPATGVEPYRLSLATTGNISGVVFDDANADGIRQAGENPLEGETVYLDLNNNGQFDSAEPTVVTTNTGYTFQNINAGNYAVRLKTPTGGRRTTTPNAVANVSVSGGQTVAAAVAFGVTSVPPTAVIGGTATVAEGSAIPLDASASGETFGVIAKYEWDFNYDGTTFDIDTTGATPIFDAGQIDGPAARNVALRVTDANGLRSLVVSKTISITNAAPTALFGGDRVGEAGQPLAFGYGSPTDPGVADRTSLKFGYDYNNDGDFADPGEYNDARPSTGYSFASAGSYVVHGRVTDKDGAFTDYYTPVVIAPAQPPADPGLTIEAENGVFAGGTAKGSSNGGFTGTGYADFGGQNSSAQWTVPSNLNNARTLTFRYANGGTSDRPLSIIVNGATIGSVACVPTGSWTTWATVSITANLIAGSNTIRAVATATVGGGNVDSLNVFPPPVTPPAWFSPGTASWWLTNNTLVIKSGNATLLADAGLASPGLSIVVLGGTLTSNTSQHLAGLGARGAFILAPGGGKVLRATSIAGGSLTLNDNDLILDYAANWPVEEAIGWVKAWPMPGTANANRAYGYSRGADFLAAGKSTFDGEAIDSTSLLVKYTFAGDATLDGKVDFNDFLRLQNSFGRTGAAFSDGDFNGDGVVNFNDFLLLQNNFGAI